ncbi:hypothetical protein [Jeotgalicoccus sp. WY2]|uniref:hypothetical protein n=1 Tax=Jeotgalicoccus sp. WY2 TaxID=2708346 RepID=UPI002021BDE5|nr:hypothetical protein [Jeotgalicoccus sp. WY2]
MRKLGFLLTFTLSLVVLTGCMYPDDQRAGSNIPPETDIQNVQNAVDNFQESEGGILPIKRLKMLLSIWNTRLNSPESYRNI